MQPKMPESGLKDCRKCRFQSWQSEKASMGVIQITAPNSGEDYSWGGAFNTSSKEKKQALP